LVQKQRPFIPAVSSLQQNFPNPFNPTTTITFCVGENRDQFTEKGNSIRTSLYIFDLLGRRIADLVDERLDAGTYSATWDAVNVPSGIYFYRLQYGNYSETKRMVMLK
jgi:hypothetical protein